MLFDFYTGANLFNVSIEEFLTPNNWAELPNDAWGTHSV